MILAPKKRRRIAAIELVIGHLKIDFRLNRNYLWGKELAQIIAFLVATGWNLKKYMKKLKHEVFWIPFLFLIASAIYSLVDVEGFLTSARAANDWILINFGWLFSISTLFFLGIVIVVYFSPLGKVRIGGKKATPILEEEFIAKYPKCYEYLLSEKEKLKGRGKGKKIFSPFYVWGRTQGITRFGKKIINPTFSKHPRFLFVPEEDAYLTGFLILQLANIAFAVGQWTYQRWADQTSNAGNMSWMYLGGALFASLMTFPQLNWGQVEVTNEQVGVLLYLGIVASGLCFYLWNSGSKQVSPATLAVMNNGYIPIAVIASIVLFSETADITRLLIGGSLIALSIVISYQTNIDRKSVLSD